MFFNDCTGTGITEPRIIFWTANISNSGPFPLDGCQYFYKVYACDAAYTAIRTEPPKMC